MTPVGAQYAGDMAGKEIDKQRANAALAVIRQHPGMALFLAAPVLAVLGAVWWIAGLGWALVLTAVIVIAGGAAIVMRRS
ncbi:hypothetical protein CCUG63695_02008 [Mycobacteroides franklinii]|uniref:Uncharacterized protein n=2 Tax=Mycobacteroides franklinii TaxID=948102 RepID=A0A4R8R7I2_9MYCO|nr:hypothetical protein CCUG64054_02081 [Mycobacteroides franklinii]TDZ52195.1 hypothetical protein CCUG63697_00666 [Mycobacteroides franklinii]TDZ55602.1 hypothetical protein CCUG63696_02084 [Mycobacteroides franklinii]TDZ62543.1 hypothetical protein CCUG63695_02008 [Mycobacteroides franklinii]TDZ68940.1 hypothetical protein CCUG64056_02081 [Mycobacteroides franklinii]